MDIRIAEALEDHPDSDSIIAAVVVTPIRRNWWPLQSGEQIILTGDGLKAVGNALTDKATPSSKSAAAPSSVSRWTRKKGKWQVVQMPEVEGAFVSMDLAPAPFAPWWAASDFYRNKFNHVTQAWRQPGSSFKPFIYSGALEKGFTPATVVNDAPCSLTQAPPAGNPGAQELRR